MSLQTTGFATQHVKIRDQYESLAKLMENLESVKYAMTGAMQGIPELEFGEYTCRINRYIQKRMQNKGIPKIMNIERPDISPAVNNLFQHSQPTIASVERCFSMLQKVLAKDRHIKVENVKQHMILHFNSCSW